jgi:hypothetical protein
MSTPVFEILSGLEDSYDQIQKKAIGGMAEIYVARQKNLDRPVAIKPTRTSARSSASGSSALPERCHRDPPEPPRKPEDSCDWYDLAERLYQGEPRSYLFSQLHRGADGLTDDSDDNVVWGH